MAGSNRKRDGWVGTSACSHEIDHPRTIPLALFSSFPHLFVILLKRKSVPALFPHFGRLGDGFISIPPSVWRAEPILFVVGPVRKLTKALGKNGTLSAVKDFYEGQVSLAQCQPRVTCDLASAENATAAL